MIDILEKLEEINTRIIRISAKIDQILSGGN